MNYSIAIGTETQIEQEDKRLLNKYMPYSLIVFVSEHLKLDIAKVMTPLGVRKYSNCRYIIFYFLNKYGYIQQDISNIIGLKERSTVVSGLKTINGFLDIKDEFFTDNIKLIESKL